MGVRKRNSAEKIKGSPERNVRREIAQRSFFAAQNALCGRYGSRDGGVQSSRSASLFQ